MTGNGISRTTSDEEDPSQGVESQETDVCPVCKGDGWVRRLAPLGHTDFGQLYPCICQKRQAQDQRESRLQRYSNLGPLGEITFETVASPSFLHNPENQVAWKRSLVVAQEFADEPQGWMVLAGPSGCGKTSLAAAIANRCLQRGQPTLFMVVPDLLDHLRAAYAPDSPLTYDQLFDQVRNAPLLVLDGLGAHSASPWAQEKLFQVLNHRFNAQMPTVITLLCPIEELDPGLRTRLEAQGFSQVVNLARNLADTSLLQVIGALGDRMRDRMTFDRFDLSGSISSTSRDRETLRAAHDVAQNFARSLQGWLFLTGPSGIGKKHLSVAIINERLKLGQRCCFALVPDLLDHLRAAFNPENKVSYDQRFDRIKTSPLLVLDNLGAEQSTPWAEEKLFQVIEFRYNLEMPTVITSNDSMEDLEKTRPRIASRLKDSLIVQWIAMTAPDYRDQGSQMPPAPRRGRPPPARR